MKRTPLKRGNKPLKRKTPLRARKPGKKSEPGSTAYLKWIRTLPCVVCSGLSGRSEAAHTKVLGSSGMGEKATHRSCIPLCAWDHTLLRDSYHEMTEAEWAELHGIDLPELVASLNGLYESLRLRRAA